MNLNAREKPVFNADSSWNYLLTQCRFGPRNPGSQAHSACRDYLKKELSGCASRVRLQPFTHTDKRLKTTYALYNIIADFGSENSGRKILLCAHWDCRPRADQDKVPANRTKPILGANDGASGTAVLLEIARPLKQFPPPGPVQIALFDGEDYGLESETWDYLLGSRYFASNADPSEYQFAILLDMIGDANLEIKKEFHSYRNCNELQTKIWDEAKRLGLVQFSSRLTPPITDDHLPLIEAGIQAVVLIDFDYPFWHTLQDTPDKCSKESLSVVGKVLLEIIYGK
jgi:Zn-dependent M28 family amino/carboxypeptidase